MIQRARRLLGDTIELLHSSSINTSRWKADLTTIPELAATRTVQIGHVLPNQATFRASRFDVPVLWWVNEGNKAAAVDDLYDALSREEDAGSLVQQLLALDWIVGIDVSFVGSRVEGPTGFLVAESTVSIVGAQLPDGS